MKSIITKYSLFVIAFLILTIGACKLDDTTISGVPQLEFTTINQFSNKIGATAQTFTINANENQEIMGSNGVKVVIPQNTFTTNTGEDVNGMVDIQLKEMLTKSEMVLSNKPTEADGLLLETVGAFLLEASQGSNALNISQPIGVELEMDSSIDDPTALGIYYGNQVGGAGGSVNWVLDTDSQVPLNAGIHSFDMEQLAWATCAKPLDSSETFKLTVSPGSLTELNDEQGYVIFENSNTVAALSPEGSKFVRNDYPAGASATVVMIAIDPISIYLSIVTDVNLDQDKTVNANYSRVTEAELITMIEALN